jgi:pterin-4a-carbinolamine dehydratase/tRNA(Arg) A34 adenosine deaminase TadA
VTRSGVRHALVDELAAEVQVAMGQAVALARSAPYPFGAVLLDVDTRTVVARAAATADSDHAESSLLRGAGLPPARVARSVLVSTAEPCPMCAAAAVFAKVAGICYGSSISTLIRYGWPQIDIPAREVVARTVAVATQPALIGGILETACDLLYAQTAEDRAKLADHSTGRYHARAATARLTETEIARRLSATPDWWLDDGRLHRSFHCVDFEQSMRFVNQMAALARRANHHPDFSLERKRTVHVTLRTNKLASLTALDFDLAAGIGAAYANLIARTP